MSFILRATAVIVALTYFAAERQGRPIDAGGLVAKTTDVAAVLSAIPAEARAQLATDSLSALGLRLATAPSRDTLGASDRRPAWHGLADN